MQASILYDTGAALFLFGAGLFLFTLIISVIEAVVMLFLKWGKFWRSLWVSLLMNVTSTIFGIVGARVGFLSFSSYSFKWLPIVIAFLLSVLIEAGVLILAKRGATRLNWLVSFTANISSYLLVILPLFSLRD